MSVSNTKSHGVDAAKDLVVETRELEAKWVQHLEENRAELEHLEANLGSMLLDAPDQEDELIARMTRLRGRVAAAELAVQAQKPIVLAAEQSFLAAEAARHRELAAAGAVAREAHRAKVNALLEKLRDVDDASYMATDQVARMLVSAGLPCEMVWRPSKVRALDKVVSDAMHRAEALEALAAGQALEPLLLSWGVASAEVLPASVYGPGAVVAAPQWRESVARAKQTFEELQEVAARLPQEIADWTAKERAEQRRAGEYGSESVRLVGLDRRKERARTIGADLEAARGSLESMSAAAEEATA